MKIENLRESDNIFTYKEMSILANTTPERFLKDSKRYESTLQKQGYRFTKEGKGKKAIYTITQDKDNIPWEEMNFKQRFKYSFDIELKYPDVMEKYMIALKNNTSNIQYLSDENASEIIGCTRQRLNHCRKILEQKELIIPIEYQSQATYLIYHDDYEVEEISKKEFSRYWKNYFTEKKEEISTQGKLINNRIECEPEVTKKINKQAMKNLQEEIEGFLVKIKKKEPTNKFYIVIDELISQ